MIRDGFPSVFREIYASIKNASLINQRDKSTVDPALDSDAERPTPRLDRSSVLERWETRKHVKKDQQEHGEGARAD